MYLTICMKEFHHPDILIKGWAPNCLGVIIDSNLTFEKQVEEVISTVKLNLRYFYFIRNQLSTVAAKLYIYFISITFQPLIILLIMQKAVSCSLHKSSATQGVLNLFVQAFTILLPAVSVHFTSFKL